MMAGMFFLSQTADDDPQSLCSHSVTKLAFLLSVCLNLSKATTTAFVTLAPVGTKQVGSFTVFQLIPWEDNASSILSKSTHSHKNDKESDPLNLPNLRIVAWICVLSLPTGKHVPGKRTQNHSLTFSKDTFSSYLSMLSWSSSLLVQTGSRVSMACGLRP